MPPDYSNYPGVKAAELSDIFDPGKHGLPANFRLTSFSKLKG